MGETRSATYLRRLEALNELATAVNSTLDAREVCQRALERTREFFPRARWFCLRLLTPDRQGLQALAHVGDPEHRRRWPRLSLAADHASVRAFRTGEIQYNWDTQQNPVPAGTREIVTRFEIGAYLALPLVHRGEPIGSLLIAWPEPTVLCPDELEFCRNVGLQLSNALANARLYEAQVRDRKRLAEKNQSLEHSSTRHADRARGREQEMEALLRLSSHISRSLDEETATTTALDSCLSLTGSEFGFLALHDPAGQIQIACVRGLGEAASDNWRECLETAEYWARYESVLFGRGAVCLNEPDAAIRALPPAPVPIRNLLCVPLLCGEQQTGAIGLANKPTTFDAEDTRLLMLFAGQVAATLQNARRYQHRRRELTHLSRAVQELSQAQEEQTVCDRIAEIIREVFPCRLTWLMLCDTATQTLQVRTFHGEGEDCFGRVFHPLDQGIVGEVVRSGTPRFIPDVAAEPRFLFHEEAMRLGIRSALYVPLVVREKTIGVLGLCSEQFNEQQPPPAADLDLLLTFASIAAVAIQDARHGIQERQQTTREQLLNQITAAVRESMESADVLARAVEQLGRALGTSRCFALLPQENGEYEEYGYCVPGCEVDPHEILWDACPVVRQVQETGKAAAFEAVPGCELFEPAPRSLLAIPAARQGRPVGMFLFHQCDRERTWSEEEIELAQRVADQAAIAVENARLYRQAVESEQFQRTLVETATAVGASVSLSDVLKAVCTQGQKLLGADGVYVWRIDEATRELVGTEAVGHKAERFLGLRVSLARGGGLAAKAIHERRAILVPSVAAESGTNPRLNRIFDVQSVLVVPLIAHGEAVGAAVFTATAVERRFDRALAGRAEILVSQAAAALGNAQLYEETRRRADELQVLWRIGQEITENLDAEAVLRSIVNGAREVMAVDACSLMLLEGESERLAVRASHGLSEAHIRAAVFPTGSRIPRCLGLDGQVHVTPNLAADRVYPRAATEDGLRSMLSVPMFDGSRPSGVLNVYSSRRRHFQISEAQTLATLASFASVALKNARAFEREHHIAETFQDSLTPDLSVHLEGVEIAKQYIAALDAEASVGGDFYDLIRLDDTRMAVVIGDVSGKGLDAAMQTAMIKFVLRAFATESPEPAQLLSRVNRVLCQTFTPELFVSLFYGILDVERHELTYANAGHELPLVLRRGETGVELLVTTGPVLGLGEEADYHEVRAPMEQGDTLVLYTDGFTEARRGDEFLQIEGLATLLGDVRDEDAQTMAERVYHSVRSYAGGSLHDDATILVVKSLVDVGADER